MAKAGRAAVVVLTAAAVIAAGALQAAAEPEGTIEGAGQPGAITGQYIVVFRTSAPEAHRVPSAAHSLASRYAGTVARTYDSALHGFTVRMTERQARRLAANPAVAYVQQDREVPLAGTEPNPPSWGLDRVDQYSLPLNGSYTYPSTASTVHAYVLDTGIRISHSEFGGRASYGYDFIDNDSVADDCHGHGTHVAGTIGGATYGVAKAVRLVAVRVLDCTGSGSYSQIISGVDWVTAHAIHPAVANMSLGGPPSQALDDAITASIASGVTYAVAAGNSNTNACNVSPANTPAAITVAATDSSDNRASFSNYGPCVDIFAPGVNIRSSYNTSDTATATMSGTSMATPHVVGAAALLLAADPTLTPAQVAQALVDRSAAGRVGNPGSATPNRLLFTGTPQPLLRSASGAWPHGSSAILGADGTPQYFDRANDATLAWTRYTNPGLSTTSVGGSLAGTPTAVRAKDGTVYVFGRTTTNHLQVWTDANGVWSVVDAGGSLAGEPVVASASTVPSVYGRAVDGSLWQWYFYSGQWYDRSLGGTVSGDPAVTGVLDGVPMVFAADGTGGLAQWYYANARWYHRPLGGSIAGQPVPSAAAATVPTLFGRAADGSLYQWYYWGWNWYSRSLGGTMSGDPAVTGAVDGLPMVFAADGTGGLAQWYYANAQWYHRPLGGNLAGQAIPSAASATVPSLYGRATDGTLQQWYYYGAQWYSRSLGGTLTGDPAVTGPVDAPPWVFGSDGSGTAHYWYYVTPTWQTGT